MTRQKMRTVPIQSILRRPRQPAGKPSRFSGGRAGRRKRTAAAATPPKGRLIQKHLLVSDEWPSVFMRLTIAKTHAG